MSAQSPLDRCPGVLRPFSAADGNLVRLRQPGGRFDGKTLVGVADAAQRYGAPFVQLTSRGNLQVRGLPDAIPQGFVTRLDELGLLPSASHERVRNVVAAPGSGLDKLISELDEGIVSDAQFAHLSGRWLFVLSDATGDALEFPYDVAYQQFSLTDGVIHFGGCAFPCPPSEATHVLLETTRLFLSLRPHDGIWNVTSLPSSDVLLQAVSSLCARASSTSPGSAAPDTAPAPGADSASDSLTIGVPLGLLTPEQATYLAGLSADLVVTPRRSIVARNVSPEQVDADALQALGLELGGEYSAQVTACIGAPYCRRTLSPTVKLTQAALPSLNSAPPRRVHVVGCERSCGSPKTPHDLVIAPRTVTDILTTKGTHA